ncbi:hypothetical protein [Lichenicola sp.]|uniref:hypothetical protein n=1 Tax=Lichenicola sp. TaxID=2804529 RepID=UPI003B00914C
MRTFFAGTLLCCLAGCGFDSAVVAVGPDTYTLSVERAPALGGGREANRLVLAEASRFCLQQARVSTILDLRPDGDPFTPYYPTAFDIIFRCATPAAGNARTSGPAATPG